MSSWPLSHVHLRGVHLAALTVFSSSLSSTYPSNLMMFSMVKSLTLVLN